jgi:hypothetical protein
MTKMNWQAAKRRDMVMSSRRDHQSFEGAAPAKKKKIKHNPDLILPVKQYEGVGVSYVTIGGNVIDVGLANPLDKPDFIASDMSAALALIDELRTDARFHW